jgi:hypothetical protein
MEDLLRVSRNVQSNIIRFDALWIDEFRTLQSNPDVLSIHAIDPDTGIGVLLWSR